MSKVPERSYENDFIMPPYVIAIFAFAVILVLVIISIVAYAFYKCNQASKQRAVVRKTRSVHTTTLGRQSSTSESLASFNEKTKPIKIIPADMPSTSGASVQKASSETVSQSNIQQSPKLVNVERSTELTLEGEDFFVQSPGMDIDELAAAMRSSAKNDKGSSEMHKKLKSSSKERSCATQTTATTQTNSIIN